MKTNPEPPSLQPILRVKIREVLALVPLGRKLPENMIADSIKALGYEFDSVDLKQAMEWNHSRNFIDYVHDFDYERDEWSLTDKGRKHD